MRTLVIDANNRVVDAIMADAGYEVPGLKLVASEAGGPGDLYDPETGEISPPPPAPPEPPPVPETISDRQFFQQLAVEGLITQDEALAAVKTGEIPSAMQALVGQLPAEQQFPAQMLLCGATQFQRSNGLTLTIGQLYHWNADELDTFWRAAAAL